MSTAIFQIQQGELASSGVLVADEERLIAGAKDGHEGAWAAIYETNFPPVYRYVHARIFDEPAAADVAANVFVAAIGGIRSYTYRGRPILAWLYRIAHNLVGEYRRKNIRESSRNLGAVNPLPPGNGSHLNGDPAGMVEDLDLRKAIQNLPEKQREALVLRFYVGLSTPEIAQLMGKQPAAVYSLQARAVASLRGTLE